MKVWIFQTGEPLHCDAGSLRPMRAMNLANALVAAGHKVVLWSSSFYHQEKRQRVTDNNRVKVSGSLEIRLVASPGYQRNIGPGRLWDHAVLGRNLAKLLDAETTVPDVAFVGYPPIETAAVMTRWLAARRVPCMVDVKDQWPAIFIDALPAPLKLVGRIALAPYFYYGRRALRDATALSHPRTRAVLLQAGRLERLSKNVTLIEPVGYLGMVQLEKYAALIATNSGGVQKEAFFFSVPCVTLRDETEWVELVASGWNRLAPPVSGDAIRSAIEGALGSRGQLILPYGDGRAAEKIVNHLAQPSDYFRSHPA